MTNLNTGNLHYIYKRPYDLYSHVECRLLGKKLSLFLVLIAEVTQPSLGVGYEIGRAIERGKTILCLFRPSSGRGLPLKLSHLERA